MYILLAADAVVNVPAEAFCY